MKYSRSHKKIIIGTQNGVLAVLPVEAELLDEDEEEEENAGKEKAKKVIDVPLQIIGKYHTAPIVAIKNLQGSTQFITISEDQTIAIWEATTGQQIASIMLTDRPTSMSVTHNGMVAFVGTAEGAFLIFDISTRTSLRLVKQMKFFETSIPISFIKTSDNGSIVMIASRESERIFIISQKSSENFTIYGYLKMDGYILSLQYAYNAEGLLYAAAILSNNLIQVAFLPLSKAEDRMNPLPEGVFHKFVRKVDRGTNMILTSKLSNKFFVSGDDRYLKQYDIFPSDTYLGVDWRKPPI